MSAWAVDATVKEDYGPAVSTDAIVTTSGQTFQGATAVWNYRYAKSQVGGVNRDTIVGKERAIQLQHTSGKNSYFECQNWEGGIKKLQFDWRMLNAADNGQQLKLQIKIDGEQKDIIEENGRDEIRTANVHYTSSAAVDLKATGKITIANVSKSADGSADAYGRMLVGPLTITPYLLYTQKVATIGSKQKGYRNEELINNTGGGTITYTSKTESVATVDAEGYITPVATGNTTITATWSEQNLSTTYTLYVEDNIIVENFSKVKQTSASSATPDAGNWVGDLFAWTAVACRRGVGDTISVNPRQQATWLAYNTTPSSLTTTAAIEGGVKHLAFTWRQWSAQVNNTTTKVKVTFNGEDDENKIVKEHSVENATQYTNRNFDADGRGDINGALNATLKIENVSIKNNAAQNNRIVIENIKITPYILYTTKSLTWDRSVDLRETFTNTDFINNAGEGVSYAITAGDYIASIDPGTGAVSATQGGNITITASYGGENGASTWYNLHIKAKTTASFAQSVVSVGLDGSVSNTLNKTTGYSGSISYGSDNTSVATVNPTTGVVTIVGVGQTTITATLAGNDDYSATTASYNLYVTDNSANVLVETFENVSQETETNDTIPWHGKLFDWRVFQVRRNSTTDTIRISKQGTWIRIHNAKRGFMQSEDVVEGGIKHISFYWRQWATESDQTLRLAVLAGEKPAEATRIEKMERSCESGGAGALHEKYLFGASNVMRSNQKLVIRNESFTGEAYAESSTLAGNSVSRLIIDDIHITPWLLYMRKSVSIAVDGGTFINEGLINTTAGESGTLSYSSSNHAVATVEKDGDGQCVVTPHAIGVTTIEAKFDWGGGNYVTTTYQLNVVSALVRVENYANATKQGQQIDPITYTGNYSQSWTYRKVRIKDDRVNSEQAIWMSRYWDGSSNTKNCYIETTSAEGGIKQVSFNWQQANDGDDGKILCLDIKVAGERVDGIEEEGSASLRSDYQTCTKNLQVKSNSKFTLHNNSHVKNSTNIANGRILVGPITITPYLFYLEREKTIMTGETYINPMIDNTDGEGTVTYSLISPSTAGAATINAKTGEVTTLTPGTVTVKALWSEGAYTTYTLHIVDVILEDEANNSATIEAKDGLTVGVLLKDRTIRTGGYNTLCLPFDVSEETLQATLPGAKAYEFTNAYLSESNLDIRFDKVTELEAGKPYLVTVPADVANPVFENVTIDASSTANNIIVGESMRFIGSFNQGTMNETGLYVVADKLYRASYIENEEDRTIGACRAYFDVLQGAQAVPRNVRMRIVAGKETTTDVVTVSGDRLEVSGKFIENGQLIIIRDGKMYNAQGMRIR